MSFLASVVIVEALTSDLAKVIYLLLLGVLGSLLYKAVHKRGSGPRLVPEQEIFISVDLYNELIDKTKDLALNGDEIAKLLRESLKENAALKDVVDTIRILAHGTIQRQDFGEGLEAIRSLANNTTCLDAQYFEMMLNNYIRARGRF